PHTPRGVGCPVGASVVLRAGGAAAVRHALHRLGASAESAHHDRDRVPDPVDRHVHHRRVLSATRDVGLAMPEDPPADPHATEDLGRSYAALLGPAPWEPDAPEVSPPADTDAAPPPPLRI